MSLFGSLFGSRGSATEAGHDSWSMFEGTRDGRPMIVRGNTGLSAVAGKPPFGYRFGVAIPLHSPREDGFPTTDESKELAAIEDALLATLPASTTRFALVITTSGFREFVFYTSAPDTIPPAMHRLQKEITSHRLQFYVERDEAWQVYHSFIR